MDWVFELVGRLAVFVGFQVAWACATIWLAHKLHDDFWHRGPKGSKGDGSEGTAIK